MRYKSPLFVLSISLISWNGFAQTAVLPGGGESAGSGGTSSFSLGQVAYTTVNGTSGSSAQGVQHAYVVSDASVTTVVDDPFLVNVYPNPTTNFIVIQLEETHNETLSYRLLNAIGQEVQNGLILKDTTQLTLTEHQSAYYMLQIIKDGRIARTFKVLKTN